MNLTDEQRERLELCAQDVAAAYGLELDEARDRLRSMLELSRGKLIAELRAQSAQGEGWAESLARNPYSSASANRAKSRNVARFSEGPRETP